MTTPQPAETLRNLQTLTVYSGTDFTVTDGANFGDPLWDADELMLDDIYTLSHKAPLNKLTLSDIGTPPFTIATGSVAGTVGHQIHLDCAITLMGPDSSTLDAVILVEVDKKSGDIHNIHMLTLAPIDEKTGYRLVGIDRDSARVKLAQIACASFTGGTRITMANGEQRRVDDIRVGDKLLSRDSGPQAVRWIGHNTVRASGDFAPILITKGTLSNENDLLVSANHRLFIYQRHDEVGAGRAEILIKAKHLVNGASVTVQTGGFVDYFQLLFDDHQIIFAEGIAAESLLLDENTTAAIPSKIGGKSPLHGKHLTDDFELRGGELISSDMAARLKRASRS